MKGPQKLRGTFYYHGKAQQGDASEPASKPEPEGDDRGDDQHEKRKPVAKSVYRNATTGAVLFFDAADARWKLSESATAPWQYASGANADRDVPWNEKTKMFGRDWQQRGKGSDKPAPSPQQDPAAAPQEKEQLVGLAPIETMVRESSGGGDVKSGGSGPRVRSGTPPPRVSEMGTLMTVLRVSARFKRGIKVCPLEFSADAQRTICHDPPK